MRALAELLAREGHLVLRFDHAGTGDSAGERFDAHRAQEGVVAAVAELRRFGCERVAVVGVEAGGLFALRSGADTVVAWRPVVSGRRYVRGLRLRATEFPGDASSVVIAGEVFSADALDALAALDATPATGVRRALIVDDDADKLTQQLREGETEVDAIPATGSDDALQTNAERAAVPWPLVRQIAGWIGPATGDELDPPRTADAASFDWGGHAVREAVLRVGPHRLAAIVTEPADRRPDAATLLLLNAGSEPHYGPGRSWVVFARELAAAGHRAVRLDYRSWGESPDGGREPLRTYAPHCVDDVIDAVDALRELGHTRVVPFGLCASAWVALKAALRARLDAVIALNPQLYWDGGHFEGTADDIRTYRAPFRRREEKASRFGVWSALDAVGLRPASARWLERLARGPTPVVLLFAEDDEGLTYLRLRIGRRLASALRRGNVRLVEIPGIDHAMHRAWLRDAVIEELDSALRQAAASPPS
jgi:pimeloyl-ACP methyl ester carboxylesterase